MGDDTPIAWLDLAWFPVIVLVQLLLTTGLALLVSALTVHFRDVRDLLQNLLTVWFFATPIIYPLERAPERWRRLLELNPFTHIAVAYQEVLFRPGPFTEWPRLLAVGAGFREMSNLVTFQVDPSPRMTCSIWGPIVSQMSVQNSRPRMASARGWRPPSPRLGR